ncbi:MAG: hypothetical protein GY820_41780, partial [Gammaproteobacteria bacterium]|nr:hypothetical protein [Gammaproteobacteria bacterium]
MQAVQRGHYFHQSTQTPYGRPPVPKKPFDPTGGLDTGRYPSGVSSLQKSAGGTSEGWWQKLGIAEQKPLECEDVETEFPPGDEPKPSSSRVVQFKSQIEVEPLWRGIDDGAKKVVSPLDEGPIKTPVVSLSNVQPPTPGTGWQLTPTSPWSCPNQRTIVPPKQSVIFTNLGQEHLNSMDRLLWDNILTMLGALPNIRAKGELPYEKVLMKEYTRGLQQSVCPTMPN